MRAWWVASLCVALTFACASDPAPYDPLHQCLIEGDTPQSIADAVTRLNALPQPVTIPCFVASLPRPIHLVGTHSVFSAQPADTRSNPRIFILSDDLAMSIVPDGAGQHLLEFGEWTSIGRSIKGELEFPISAPLTGSEPFDVLYNETLTNCGLCHRAEVPYAPIPGAFESDAFQPEPGTRVSLYEMRIEHLNCDADQTPERCQIYHSLFDFGTVLESAFHPNTPTFLP